MNRRDPVQPISHGSVRPASTDLTRIGKIGFTCPQPTSQPTTGRLGDCRWFTATCSWSTSLSQPVTCPWFSAGRLDGRATGRPDREIHARGNMWNAAVSFPQPTNQVQRSEHTPQVHMQRNMCEPQAPSTTLLPQAPGQPLVYNRPTTTTGPKYNVPTSGME